ncbi:MAG: hypothetical protein GPJ54_11745 [Candidatus Heimdallarchaeota archaeon]|nr:hypothetical protein [Candidatus Heimdallarchaeota archaeon]
MKKFTGPSFLVLPCGSTEGVYDNEDFLDGADSSLSIRWKGTFESI